MSPSPRTRTRTPYPVEDVVEADDGYDSDDSDVFYSVDLSSDEESEGPTEYSSDCAPSVASTSTTPDCERSPTPADCISVLSEWVALYTLYKFTGLNEKSDIDVAATPTYGVVLQTVRDLLEHPFQSPFTLLHMLYYVKQVALDGYAIPIPDLYDEYSEDIQPLCVMLRMCFVLACEAMEDEDETTVDQRASLAVKLEASSFNKLVDFDMCHSAVRGAICGSNEDYLDEDSEEALRLDPEVWRHFSYELCALALRHYVVSEGLPNLPAVVLTSFLELSDCDSKLGHTPFERMPLSWLVSYDGVRAEEDEEEAEYTRKIAVVSVPKPVAVPVMKKELVVLKPKPVYAIDIALLESESWYL
ncbi:hypothetical protein CYLTODRAFT_422954 [Cylindrobasidium torrendii FP15055 ss-10]|uniref:Uncharacterized protein n=1 Tax=Cylindrobasidium torrendii FP15055 ss-10 TaxID=1314674 RepID=A0A0D7BBQ7_9AGAR|nr:hypothetical protein CYLTODRAFT_422954 [Cylindrobasidium torrendii FP15055 ss-10]